MHKPNDFIPKEKGYAVLKVVMALLLVLPFSLALSSCKPDNPGPDAPGGSSPNPAPPGSGVGIGTEGDYQREPEIDLNDMSYPVSQLPNQQAINDIWSRLAGYWTLLDGRYIGFVSNGDVKFVLYGFSDSENSGFGELQGIEATGAYSATLTVHYAAMPATENSPASPEREVTMAIDLEGLGFDGTISVSIADVADGEWNSYTFSGYSLEEALRFINRELR